MKEVLDRRIAALREVLERAGLRGAVLHRPGHVFHLLDWLPPAWATAFAVIGPRGCLLVSSCSPPTGTMQADSVVAFETFSLTELVIPSDRAVAALRAALHQAGLEGQPVGAVLDSFPAVYATGLSENASWRDITQLVAMLTAVKDEAAQQAIRTRIGMLDQAFAAAAAAIRSGITEIEVHGVLYAELTRSLGSPCTMEGNLASGPRTLDEEPAATDRRMNPGDLVLIDLVAHLGGYTADYCRNFVLGPATDRQLAQHAALEKCLTTIERALRPGVLACDIDRLARRILEDEGYGPYSHRHHTGHGFGLHIPEPPWIIPADRTPLRPGMILAIEPGIYHPADGGMRLEGDYLITVDGCEPMAGYPAQLTSCSG